LIGGFAPTKLNIFNPVYYLPYDTNLKEFSRRLRKNSTLGEILLWQNLRAGSVMNYTFNRQKPLNRYIVDFYCKPLNLVIEIDGYYHYEQEQMIMDKERQRVLEEMGLSFLRFSELQVRKDMDWVLKEIKNYIVTYEKRLDNSA
jgi:very-short-patch-repair endonuclease